MIYIYESTTSRKEEKASAALGAKIYLGLPLFATDALSLNAQECSGPIGPTSSLLVLEG